MHAAPINRRDFLQHTAIVGTQVQGYLFSPPRPAAEVEKMLSRVRPRVVA